MPNAKQKEINQQTNLETHGLSQTTLSAVVLGIKGDTTRGNMSFRGGESVNWAMGSAKQEETRGKTNQKFDASIIFPCNVSFFVGSDIQSMDFSSRMFSRQSAEKPQAITS